MRGSENRRPDNDANKGSLQRGITKSHCLAMAWTGGRRDPESMKTKRILSIIGSTLLVLSPTNWAVAHGGGGGGGFHGGGMAFHGSGIGFRGGGVGFRSAGPRFGGGSRAFANQATRQSRTFGRAEFNRRIAAHIAERHDANWHRDWDRRHAHFDHNRFFVFNDGFWCGLDADFFPWDYFPYYAYDYYPYDYYPGYDADAEQYGNTTVRDRTVNAVQGELALLGFYEGPMDGIYGRLTRDAVAKYQIARKLDVSGSLSAQTLQSLGLPRTTPS
jgi:hypothetical protein